ncbi:MAG: efflux RND transporter periplasmic adaptor subunit, partial [Caulobacterales bacterium]|nr:efflux RND transporter periplasmic adaptor subunit [Caulobacterales bacterium]
MTRHLLALGAVVMLAAAPAAAQEDRAPRVLLAAAEIREVAPSIEVPATLASRHDSDVAAEAEGRITFIAEAGDIVEEGAAVARIDAAEARLNLEEAKARVRRLEVSLAQQSRDVGRREALTSRGNLPESQLDEIAARRDMTALELEEARVAVARAEVELARTEVVAPFTGLVVERLAEVGEYASAGGAVARLVDLEAVEARAQAPVGVARYVRQGAELELTSDFGAVSAPVSTIIAAGDAFTRTFELRVDLSGTDWIIGAPVRVRL